MSETDLLPHFIKHRQAHSDDAFRIFCAGLQQMVMNGNEYDFAVHLTCYRNNQMVQLTGEATLNIHDQDLHYIRISDRQQSLLREEVNQLLESPLRICALGRSKGVLVVEDPSRRPGVHRIDMVEMPTRAIMVPSPSL